MNTITILRNSSIRLSFINSSSNQHHHWTLFIHIAQEIKDLESIIASSDPELRDIADEEHAKCIEQLDEMEQEMFDFLLPQDQVSNKLKGTCDVGID